MQSTIPPRRDEIKSERAATALLQHIGVRTPPDENDHSTFNDQLNILSTKLQAQSIEDIDRILRISEEAATRRRAVLQKLSETLATNPVNEADLRELEDKIAATRLEIERQAASPGAG